MADLGHTTLDSADEYDYDESDDVLNYDPEGTPERVGPASLRHSSSSHWTVLSVDSL